MKKYSPLIIYILGFGIFMLTRKSEFLPTIPIETLMSLR